jgi:DNA-directed RNA polymerase subunit L
MPHPTEEVVNIRVQTTGECRLTCQLGVPLLLLTPAYSCAGEMTAVDALRGACQECQKVCNHISTQFKDAVKQYRQSHPEDIEMKDA